MEGGREEERERCYKYSRLNAQIKDFYHAEMYFVKKEGEEGKEGEKEGKGRGRGRRRTRRRKYFYAVIEMNT